MKKEKSKLKAFNVALPVESWKFIKVTAVMQDISMADLIIKCVENYKKKIDNKMENILTRQNANV